MNKRNKRVIGQCQKRKPRVEKKKSEGWVATRGSRTQVKQGEIICKENKEHWSPNQKEKNKKSKPVR